MDTADAQKDRALQDVIDELVGRCSSPGAVQLQHPAREGANAFTVAVPDNRQPDGRRWFRVTVEPKGD